MSSETPNPFSAPAAAAGPYNYSPPPPQPQNTIGLVGFIISMCGFACALGYPIGLVLSLIGLRGQPKGFAIAGSVIGGLGTLAILAVLLLYGGMFVACIGFGAAMQPQIQTQAALEDARLRIESHKQDTQAYPNEADGNDLIQGITDYWKSQVRYEPKGDGFVVRSAGPDGQFDTTDDITRDSSSFDPDVDFDAEMNNLPKTPDDSPPAVPENPPETREPPPASDPPADP